ncbi:hypothetical protein NQ176_g5771 [Zarea fungicola]|uniref:Uncharacterized protein n=1 Tax=Zarea fungicola TaxID=93591 RepID=A0ACC1N6V3_9HYPO|nr:hypothetical protein NQ176_g5771 [Lecanicillium fungicola]
MAAAEHCKAARVCKSDDCSSTPPLCKDFNLAPEFLWTEEDAFYTKIFRAWDNLPILDASIETELLAELDEIIPPFDAYIGHNDTGFRAWIKRHQRAMELGLSETPTWPKLFRLDGIKKKWKDDVWIKRYGFLVHQRDVIAKSRLQRMQCLTLDDKKRFFGLSWANPRQTVRTLQSKSPARLRNHWHDPLDYCLARVAYESYGRLNFYSIQAEFWGLDVSATKTIEVGESMIKYEDVTESFLEDIKKFGKM